MTTLMRIAIDRSTRELMGQMAMPYFGKADVALLMRQYTSMLTARHPKREVSTIHIPFEPDLIVGRIRVAIIVDGAMDQGVIIDRPAPEPANDEIDDDGYRLSRAV